MKVYICDACVQEIKNFTNFKNSWSFFAEDYHLCKSCIKKIKKIIKDFRG